MQQTQAQTSLKKKKSEYLCEKYSMVKYAYTHRGRLLKMYEKHLGSDI